MNDANTITYDDFSQLDIRIARVDAVEPIAGADKLLKITLDAGDLGIRQVAAGIKQWYSPEDLLGKQVVYLANLEPRTIRGVESQGMILAADALSQAVLLHPEVEVASGSRVR